MSKLNSNTQTSQKEGEKIDKNILTMATGFIIDEIPKSMIQSYLELIGHHQEPIAEKEVLSKNHYLK